MTRLRVAAATIAWARTPPEADVLVASLTALATTGLPVFVADGGSPPEFLDRLRNVPGVNVGAYRHSGGPRLLGQVRAALASAGEAADRILYTEPDKRAFFESQVKSLLASDKGTDPRGVLIAARDADSFGTFPSGQRLTESLTNRLLSENLGADGDYLYGPFVLPTDLVSYLDDLREDVGWGWRPYVFARAYRAGRTVRLWTGSLPCPEEQRGEDDPASRLYRIEQMAQNVHGLALGLKATVP